jgi:hypothetical protein
LGRIAKDRCQANLYLYQVLPGSQGEEVALSSEEAVMANPEEYASFLTP